MPPRRFAQLESPVHILVDGDRIPAREGEPVTVALTAAGRLTLGRSVKYHRPRGAACYVGRCDGCLMRVDGVQSVMTCQVSARDGMVVETQNVLGSARRDLLAASDWFFPDGMNHHEMFTWNESLNKVMLKIARRIAGVGTLPSEVREPRIAEARDVDVLVIGGGPAGLFAATACARAGRSVMLVDEGSRAGGSLRWWPSDPGAAPDALARAAIEAGVELRLSTSAVGIYDPWEDTSGAAGPAPARRREPPVVLLASIEAVERVHPRRTVIATGRHEGMSAFEDNDCPGVIELRAACVLLSHGVLPGERVVVAGEGALVDALADRLRAAGAELIGPVAEAALVEATGRAYVEGCVIEEAGRRVTYECDAIVVSPPTSAVYELAAQAGVEVTFSGTGFELGVGDAGVTAAPDVRAVGWARGPDVVSIDAVRETSEAAAAAIARELAS